MSYQPPKLLPLLTLALFIGAASAQPLKQEYMHRIGELYAIDCSRADSPRVRLSIKSFDVEVGNKRLRAMDPQDMSLSYWGRNLPPPEFEGVFFGTVQQPDVMAVFNLNRDKRGQYMTVDGHPKVEAELGKAVLKQKFRRCK